MIQKQWQRSQKLICEIKRTEMKTYDIHHRIPSETTGITKNSENAVLLKHSSLSQQTQVKIESSILNLK